MAYQVLARKWRPQGFSSLIGQEPIVTALSNALSEGRIAQAYIFSGIRGVGKTSAARLLAKALNCEQGPTAEPCDRCPPCLEIPRGADLDVIEVDAATYSKVEQVRELTETLRYAPARDRYKVVVLDEIHRLSRQAFDALLKIVEEPPSHLVFVFATTEIEAVPATVLSRCQEFRFRRVPAPVVAGHLRTIADSEEIEASEAALRMIARAGEGSVRDSVALLDQLATFGSSSISDEDAARLAGGLPATLFAGLLQAILGGSPAEIGTTVRRIEEEGWDPRYAYAQFLAYCRDALHLAMGGSADGVDLPKEEASALAGIAGGAGYENLLRLCHLLVASETTVRRSEAGTLALEIAWLRAAELPKLTRVEEILGGGAGRAGGGAAAGRAGGGSGGDRGAGAGRQTAAHKATVPAETAPPAGATASSGHRAEPAADDDTPGAAPASGLPSAEPAAAAPDRDPGHGRHKARPRSAEPPPPDPSEPPPGNPPEGWEPGPDAGDEPGGAQDNGGDRLRRFQEEVSRLKPPLAAFLRDCPKIDFEDGELRIYSPPDDHLLARALERKGNRNALDEALSRVFGTGTRWRRLDGEEPSPQAAEAAAEAPAQTDDRPDDHPMVQTVLDIFGGKVQQVEGRESPQEDQVP